MTRFILLAGNRSGTHFFGDVIRQHPDVHMFGEILFYDYEFLPDREENFYVHWLRAVQRDPAQITNRNMHACAHRFFAANFESMAAKRAVGMDIKYDFWERLPFVASYFIKNPPKVIHLVRKNSLRMHISSFLLTCRNHGIDAGTLPIHEFDGLVRTGELTVRVKMCKRLLETLTELELRKQRFRKIADHFEHIEISYEEMVDGDGESARTFSPQVRKKIFTFVNLPEADSPLVTTRKKVSPKRLDAVVDNFEELKENLISLGLERYLD